MKVKLSKKSWPTLANGQLWKTDSAYIQIVELGKRLIDYRMMRELGQTRRIQTSSIETMERYLKHNEARLVKGNSRNWKSPKSSVRDGRSKEASGGISRRGLGFAPSLS